MTGRIQKMKYYFISFNHTKTTDQHTRFSRCAEREPSLPRGFGQLFFGAARFQHHPLPRPEHEKRALPDGRPLFMRYSTGLWPVIGLQCPVGLGAQLHLTLDSRIQQRQPLGLALRHIHPEGKIV